MVMSKNRSWMGLYINFNFSLTDNNNQVYIPVAQRIVTRTRMNLGIVGGNCLWWNTIQWRHCPAVAALLYWRHSKWCQRQQQWNVNYQARLWDPCWWISASYFISRVHQQLRHEVIKTLNPARERLLIWSKIFRSSWSAAEQRVVLLVFYWKSGLYRPGYLFWPVSPSIFVFLEIVSNRTVISISINSHIQWKSQWCTPHIK